MTDRMIIFSGSSHINLISKITGDSFLSGEVELTKFPNGEKRVRLLSEVENQHVAILQSFSSPVDEMIIEAVMMADAMERSGAKSVTMVIPWLGYSLQDKVFRSGEPLAARVIADIVSHAYVHRVILLDLHNPSITGFFSVPTVHLRAMQLFVDYVKNSFDMTKVVVVSPDFGGLKQAHVFADHLGVELANVDKHRDLHSGSVTTVGLSGEVKDKICLVYDDVINTGGTVVEVAKFLKESGASEVHFCITHGLFAGDGLTKMEDESIDSIVITDSVEQPNLPEKVKILSIGPMVKKVLE